MSANVPFSADARYVFTPRGGLAATTTPFSKRKNPGGVGEPRGPPRTAALKLSDLSRNMTPQDFTNNLTDNARYVKYR